MKLDTQTLRTALEALYWIAIVVFLAFMFLRNNRSETLTRDQRDFRRGVADGLQFREAGMSDRSIEAFLEAARSNGMYGPYESGVSQVLKVFK